MVVSKRFWIAMMLLAMVLIIANPAFAAEEAGDCEPYSEYLKQYSGDSGSCWTCQIFMLFFDTGNEVSGYIAKAIEEPAKMLLAVGFGIWILCKTASFFSNVGDAPDIFAHMTEIGGGMIRAGIATCLLLGGSAAAFDYFVNPVLSSAAAYSTTVVSDVPCKAGETNSGSLSLPLGPGVRSSMECMIKQIANGMGPTQALARGMRCGAWHYFEVPATGLDVFWPPMWAWGCVMAMFFWVVSFLFPMALLDVIFRICIILGMLPLFVVAWVFPLTRNYATTGWNVFVQGCFIFVVASMMIGMLVKVVEQTWVIAAGRGMEAWKKQMEAGAYVDAFKDLVTAGGLSNFFIIIAVACFGIYIAPKVDEFGGKLVGDTTPPRGCAVRAIKAIVNGVIDLILLVLTIITMGAAACTYVLKVAQWAKKTADGIKQMQERIKKLRELEQRVRRAKQKIQAARNYL